MDNRSRQQVRSQFRQHGVSIRAWARSHGFPVASVYAVLAGRIRGERGEAHRIAVALGVKPQTDGELSFDLIAQTDCSATEGGRSK